MYTREIAKDIYYVGVNDRVTELFEGLWPLPYGVSYNSYIVAGSEKTALIDTVKIDDVRAFFDNLRDSDNDRKIDYLVVNHMEPDHSGSIPQVLKEYPDVRIVGNSITIGMIKGFCHVSDDSRFIAVKDGDTIPLGGHTLRFHLTPMVHWPETMMTYDIETETLFSGDAFGTFGTLDGEILDSRIDTGLYIREMYRYYSNIVGKYGRFVTAALDKLAGVPLNMICPTHGPVWTLHIPEVIEITRRLARYESEPGIVIVYASMYGNTAEAADRIAAELAAAGAPKIIMHNVSHSSMSNIISDAFRYSTIIVGSPTYSMSLFPGITEFLNAMQIREIRNKTIAAFGSFAWSPGIVEKKVKEFAESMKLNFAAACSFKQALGSDADRVIRDFARQVVAAIPRPSDNPEPPRQ